MAPLLVAVILFLLWACVSYGGLISEFALPNPVSVALRLWHGVSEGYLLTSAWQTLLVAIIGSLIAACIGIPVGFGITHFALFSAALEPYLAASQAIPAVAFAPLLVLWVGYGTTPIILLCVLMVIFPIIINTAVGVRDVDSDVVDAARLDGAHGLRLLYSIEFPGVAKHFSWYSHGFYSFGYRICCWRACYWRATWFGYRIINSTTFN